MDSPGPTEILAVSQLRQSESGSARVRYGANLVRQMTQLKNRIHAYLLMNNVKVEAGPSTEEFVR